MWLTVAGRSGLQQQQVGDVAGGRSSRRFSRRSPTVAAKWTPWRSPPPPAPVSVAAYVVACAGASGQGERRRGADSPDQIEGTMAGVTRAPSSRRSGWRAPAPGGGYWRRLLRHGGQEGIRRAAWIGWVGVSGGGGEGVEWVWWGGQPLSSEVGWAEGSNTEWLRRCQWIEWRKWIEEDTVGAICKRCKKSQKTTIWSQGNSMLFVYSSIVHQTHRICWNCGTQKRRSHALPTRRMSL
jgi:hypothetical protein